MPGRVIPERAAWINAYRMSFPGTTYYAARNRYEAMANFQEENVPDSVPEPSEMLDAINGAMAGCDCAICIASRSRPTTPSPLVEWITCDRDEDDEDYDGSYDEDGREFQIEDEEEFTLDTPPRMTLPALPGRRSRMISVEQEVIKGGDWIARELYDAGLSQFSERMAYSAAIRGGFLAGVKDDASVEAEVVYSKMALDVHETASQFEKGIKIVRQGIGEGHVKLSQHCGVHVHVDIHGWDMPKVASLYHLWNYLEDAIFRLSAAHWNGHRSLTGNDYAEQTAKGRSGPLDIGRSLYNVRGAINFGNLFEAWNRCQCLASRFGIRDACECDRSELGKTTVEFRVFNTTANARKMRAFTALCLALVGAAENHKFDAENYSPLEWRDTNAGWAPEALQDRCHFILNELPLSKGEREDLYYCMANSSINTVLPELESLNPAPMEAMFA